MAKCAATAEANPISETAQKTKELTVNDKAITKIKGKATQMDSHTLRYTT